MWWIFQGVPSVMLNVRILSEQRNIQYDIKNKWLTRMTASFLHFRDVIKVLSKLRLAQMERHFRISPIMPQVGTEPSGWIDRPKKNLHYLRPVFVHLYSTPSHKALTSYKETTIRTAPSLYRSPTLIFISINLSTTRLFVPLPSPSNASLLSSVNLLPNI